MCFRCRCLHVQCEHGGLKPGCPQATVGRPCATPFCHSSAFADEACFGHVLRGSAMRCTLYGQGPQRGPQALGLGNGALSGSAGDNGQHARSFERSALACCWCRPPGGDKLLCSQPRYAVSVLHSLATSSMEPGRITRHLGRLLPSCRQSVFVATSGFDLWCSGLPMRRELYKGPPGAVQGYRVQGALGSTRTTR